MGRKKSTKPYAEMGKQELAKATAKFDQELIIDSSREQTAEEKAEWLRAKRRRGRPKVGRGAEVISVSIEKDLLARADAMARKLKVPRARLIARGLETLLRGR